jgi:calmodulin
MPDAKLSAEQLAEFRECFAFYDRDKDGSLLVDDAIVVMRSLGITLLESDVKSLEIAIGSRKVGWDEFLSIATPRAAAPISSDELRKAFSVFDRDRTGVVSVEELRHVMTTMGEKLTEEEVEELVRIGKVPSSGSLSYSEFAALLTASSS